jgi:monoamine oxidase
VTLPLALLQRDDVVFEPVLPAAKRAAIDALGAWVNGKILLRFDERWWPEDLTFLFTTQESQLWWRPGRCRDDEAPVLTAYFGGPAVEYFRGLGEDAPLRALKHLEEMFGVSLENRLRDARFVDWGSDPQAMMSYSYVPAGALGQRAVLAAPVEQALYFAGEASSLARPSTVHGALESGRRAAAEVMSRLGAAPAERTA